MKFYSVYLVLKMQLLNELVWFSTWSCCKSFINWFQNPLFFFFNEHDMRKNSILTQCSIPRLSIYLWVFLVGESRKTDNSHANIINKMVGKLYSSYISSIPNWPEIFCPRSPYQILSQVDYRYIRFKKFVVIKPILTKSICNRTLLHFIPYSSYHHILRWAFLKNLF